MMPKVELSARRFHMLADPIRLRILLLLQEEERCVGELCELLGLSQPKISYHLKLMLNEGLIRRRSEGTWSYYSLATDIQDWVCQECDNLLGPETTN